jgi:phosphatidylinositol dimannoside acyltransferase
MAQVRTDLTDAATVGGFKLAAALARGLPGFAAQGIAPALGLGASFANAERRAMVERHLRRADPTMGGARLRRATQLAFDSYTRYWIESFRLPHLTRRTVDRGMAVEGYEHVEAALAAGKGVILALPHLGGWEWAGRWLADKGLGVTAVVEAIEPPELFEWFRDLRQKLGMNIVELGSHAGRQVLAALDRNEVVCLLSDRDIQRTGVEVKFFGESTTLPAGPATLALRSGAPVLPTAVYFTDRTDGHLGIVRPALDAERGDGRLRADVERVTQDLADELEHLIRRAPYQWHLFQPNWPSDPGYDA